MVFRERVPDVRFYRGFCALQNHRYFASIGRFFLFCSIETLHFYSVSRTCPAPAFLRCLLRAAETSQKCINRSFFCSKSVEMMHFYDVSRALPGPQFLAGLLRVAETS